MTAADGLRRSSGVLAMLMLDGSLDGVYAVEVNVDRVRLQSDNLAACHSRSIEWALTAYRYRESRTYDGTGLVEYHEWSGHIRGVAVGVVAAVEAGHGPMPTGAAGLAGSPDTALATLAAEISEGPGPLRG